MTRYEEIIEQASTEYPDIAWAVAPASKDVIDSFGGGYMLAGKLNGRIVDYYIPNKLEDARQIAKYIYEELTNG